VVTRSAGEDGQMKHDTTAQDKLKLRRHQVR
jgi:hypothetical protein